MSSITKWGLQMYIQLNVDNTVLTMTAFLNASFEFSENQAKWIYFLDLSLH